ncbi:MAG: CHAT domain-containing tetratricopeptide repeat protein [Bacteroidota bacterium]
MLRAQQPLSQDSLRQLLVEQDFPRVESQLDLLNIPRQLTEAVTDSMMLRWLDLRADLYYETGRYAEAIKLYQDLLPLYQQEFGANSRNTAELHSNLGITLGYSGRYDEAKAQYEKALTIHQSTAEPSPAALGVSYTNLGVFYERQGDYALAQQYYEEALSYRREAYGDRHPKIADCYNNLGNIQYYTGDWAAARKLYQKSYDLYLALQGPNNTNVGYACMNLAITYALEGDMAEAERLFRRDLGIRQQAYGETHPLVAYCYDNLGQLKQMQSQYDKAAQHYQRSLEISQAAYGNDHPFVAQTFGNLAKLALQQGDSLLAERHYLEALSVLGLYHKGGWRKAETVKDGPKALRMIQELFQLQAQIPSKKEAAWGTLQMGEELIEYFRTGYRAEGSQLFLQGSIVPFYESAILFAAQSYAAKPDPSYLEKAFALSEQTSSVLLRKSMRAGDAFREAGIPDSLSQKAQSLRKLVEFYDRQLKQVQDSSLAASYREARFRQLAMYDALVDSLVAVYPTFGQRLAEKETRLDIENLRSDVLQKDKGLIEYFVGQKNLFCFLITRDTIVLHQSPKPADLTEEISQMRQGIYGYFIQSRQTDSLYLQGLQQYRQSAFQLYQGLLSPIQDILPPKLLVIPQAELGYIPFEVLLSDTLNDISALREYPYLIRSHQISYAFSASQLLHRPAQAIASWDLLAVSPSFPKLSQSIAAEHESLRRNMGPLPFAREEATQIQENWPGTSKLLTDEAASLQSFKKLAGRYGILHIATHAQADDLKGASERAFLAFQPEDSSNLLYFNELGLLNLQAEMVVLSACETGIGKLYQGEGIASLARGFRQAGARSIITTLWQVNDGQTSKLMNEFYGQLALGLPKDQALHKARMRYLAEVDDFYAHPFFWGPYIAIGDMRAIPKPGASAPWLLALLAFGLSILAIWLVRSQKLG